MTIKLFETKNFQRWAKKEKISVATLSNALNEISKGIVDADLGGGLVKKRLPKQGQGKRGGHRALLAFRDNERAIFIFGFSKSDKENLDPQEQVLYKKLSKYYLSVTESALIKMCENAQLFEIYDEKS